MLGADLFTWEPSTFPTTLLFPTLPYHIALLPSLFRVLAFFTLFPVAVLALIDVLGYMYHILLLRPLGYASTKRFKDPEPSTLVSVPVKNAAIIVHPPGSASKSKPNKATTNPSPTRVRLRSRSRSPSSSSSHTSSSSPSTSPSPSPSPDETTKHTQHLHLDDDDAAAVATRPKFTTHSSMSSILRARAGSVGVDGPLFAGEEVRSESSDGSEDGEGSEGGMGRVDETSESESEGLGFRRRGRTEGRTGVPKGGVAFGFTGLEKRD